MFTRKVGSISTCCFLFLLCFTPVSAAEAPQYKQDNLLGNAKEFSAYIFGNYNASNSSIDGSLAVGGNINVSSYSIATNELNYLSSYSLIVEGNASYDNGIIFSGKVRVAGDISQISDSVLNNLPAGINIENQPLEYSIQDSLPYYQELSTSLSELPVNGSVTEKWEGVYLQGDCSSQLQVFNFDGESIKDAHTLDVKCIPANATVIINITGSNIVFNNKSLSTLTPHRERVIFNFYQANEINLSSIKIEGTILAPNAAINAENGDAIGTVIAKSWQGNMHLGNVTFVGTLENEVENQVPVAQNSIIEANEDVAIAINVVATDTEGAGLTYNIVENVQHGSLTGTAPNYQYLANANFNGSDTFMFNVNDGEFDSMTATVNITVAAVNDAPVANIDSYTVNEDEVLTVNILESILENDVDIDGDPITAIISTQPSHGTLLLNSNGTFIYTPKANFFGSDNFSYFVSDGIEQSNLAMVDITINPVGETLPTISLTAEPTYIASGQSSTLSWDVTNANTISFSENLNSDLFTSSVLITPLETTTYTITATGEGGVSSNSITVFVDESSPVELPPNPEYIAPPIKLTEFTTFKDKYSFLYDSSTPVQQGINSGVIDEDLISIIRGQILDKDNVPLSGVKVAIHNHSEFGWTLSRADGMYDMVINGGGTNTLSFSHADYFPVQRKISTNWQEFSVAPVVVMTKADPIVTTITANSHTMQAATGSTMSDADGQRTAVVVFPANTQATMILPNGTQQALTTFNVRATEYTVGENGPQAMPGSLPPTSGYTYAVELSVDEAISAGATQVTFNHVLPVYVDNFLNFPVGETVPAGWYDTEKATWIPEDNGVIIKVLSIDVNGSAILDVIGNDIAATQLELDEFNISNDELTAISQIYTEGQSFWRVPVNHFSAHDFNWPYGPPEDAVSPSEELELTEREVEPEDADLECGSIIDVQNQTLGEQVDIAGTDFSLNYRSDGTRGYQSNYKKLIQVTGATLPESLKFIDLTIIIAGKRHKQRFEPLSNIDYEFNWDGKDIYGRDANGVHTANVLLEYAYEPEYYSSYSEFEKSFALTGNGTRIIGNRSTNIITISATSSFTMGSYSNKSQGMGAWRLSAHHVLDPDNGILIKGDCISQNVSKTENVIDEYFSFLYDRGALYNEDIKNIKIDSDVEDMLFDQLGNFYYQSNGRYYKVDQNQYVTRVEDVNGYAVRGNIGKVSSDGTLYLYDSSTDKINKLNAQGGVETILEGYAIQSFAFTNQDEITFSSNNKIFLLNHLNEIIHIAGTGESTYSEDNVQALDANLAMPHSLQFDNKGALYFWSHEGRIRKINSSGIITTVLGNPNSNFANIDDGVMINDIPLLEDLNSFIIDSENNIFINLWFDYKVFKVENNVVKHFMGNGEWLDYWLHNNNGWAATDAGSQGVYSIALSPDGELYTGERLGIRKVFSNNASIRDEIINIPSSKGDIVYRFDINGRHLTTLDAKSQLPIYQFSYDGNGLLASITDRDDKVTELVRDGSNVVAINSYSGLQTQLNFDSNGFLSEITNPLSQTHSMTYDALGLMTTFTDLNNNTSSYEFDELGLLVKGSSTFGSYTHLSKNSVLDGFGEPVKGSYAIQVDSASGLQKIMTVNKNDLNEQVLTTKYHNGTVKTNVTKANGSEVKTLPVGTIISSSYSPEPRFNSQAPYASTITTTQPSGLSSTRNVSKSVVLADEDDILSATSHTNVVTVNGNESRSVYDLNTNTVTTTSAEGRNTVSTLDEKGRVVSTIVDGLATTYYTYTSTGDISSVSLQDGVNQRTSYLEYDEHGYLTSFTDALDNVTNFTSDLMGRVTQIEEVITNEENQLIDFSYDGNSNITGITLPTSDEHIFEFNALDKETAYIPPNITLPNHTTEKFYDLDKRLTRINYPSGDDVIFNYHSTKGHLNSINTPQGDISMSYQSTTGGLAHIEAANGQQLSYQYDGGLLLSESWTNSVAGSVSRQYNNHFLVKSISVNGDAIAYAYDKDNLVVQAGDLTLERDASNGSLISTTIANINTNQSLNVFSELTGYHSSYNSSTLFNTDYTRDNLGRITSLTETLNGQTTTFDYIYDQLGQLVEVKKDNAIIQSYQFDANGNKTVHNGIAATYDAQDRLLTRGSAVYLYDANGALTTINDNGETKQFSYDLVGNLLQAIVNGKTIDYIIDGKNRLVGKKVNGILQQSFLYQDQLNPIAELDKDNNVVSRFIYADKINVPSVMDKNGKIYRIISDHLGSVRLVIDISDGSIAQQLNYDVNGNVLEDSNPNFQPFGFAGGLYDQHTKFTRFGARDYDAEIGRWTSKDPIGLNGGVNVYAYVQGNPINFIDPLGLAKVCTKPLSIAGTFKSSGVTGLDLAIYHEHLFSEDGSGDNWGYGPDGLYNDNKNKGKYECSSQSYDDHLIRDAVEDVKKHYPNDDYGLLSNNCQDFVTDVLKRYEQLDMLQKTMGKGGNP